jgi:hypothetical protein
MKHAELNGKLEKGYRLVQLSKNNIPFRRGRGRPICEILRQGRKVCGRGIAAESAMTAMATMCVMKGVLVLVEVVARVSAVLKMANVAMQYSNIPTLHR